MSYALSADHWKFSLWKAGWPPEFYVVPGMELEKKNDLLITFIINIAHIQVYKTKHVQLSELSWN